MTTPSRLSEVNYDMIIELVKILQEKKVIDTSDSIRILVSAPKK